MTRNEAIRWLELIEKKYIHGGDESYDKARKEALHMAIEALERKHGVWLGKPLGGYSTVQCSVCRSAFLENSGRWNYCPNCGADMQERREDDKG